MQIIYTWNSLQDLIALGERIGNVNTGLSEETITTQLKTKTYLTGATSINMEEEVCDDQGTFSCIICQVWSISNKFHSKLEVILTLMLRGLTLCSTSCTN